MKRSNRNIRYMRYRMIGWLQGVFTVSNVAFIAFAAALFLLVLIIQRLEDPSGFFDSGSLLQPAIKRRELVVTTARLDRKKIIKPCKDKKVDQKDSGNDNSSTAKKAWKYLPAIKVFYTPKTPRPLHFRKSEAEKYTTEESHIPSRSTQLPPDIYRLKTNSNRFRTNITSKRIIRNIPATPSQVPEYDQWTKTNNEKNKVLVYSAFWDDRFDVPNVRILTIMVSKYSPNIYCRIEMPDSRHIDVVAVKKIMNEHWRLKYASYFVSCPLSKNISPPSHVSISADVDFVDKATIPIHYNKKDATSPRGNIAVCVKPLHYYYDRATWMIEFLELHRMLGVDHFYFYNHTVGPNIENVLTEYIRMGVVTALPWHLGIKSQKEIRTEGIFSSLNDCLFRTMYLFDYVIMLDFDEYIVPRDHDTYQEMLEQLEKDNKQRRGNVGSFVFRNTFFYLYWENDTTTYGVEPERPPDWVPYSLTQYKTRRLTATMKPGSRSKYIVVPHRAIEVGNHVVWRHTSGSHAFHVPERTALLHHYRICEFGGFGCLKKPSVVDQTATRFGPALLDRMRHQCERIFKSRKCPLSPPLGSPW